MPHTPYLFTYIHTIQYIHIIRATTYTFIYHMLIPYIHTYIPYMHVNIPCIYTIPYIHIKDAKHRYYKYHRYKYIPYYRLCHFCLPIVPCHAEKFQNNLYSGFGDIRLHNFGSNQAQMVHLCHFCLLCTN